MIALLASLIALCSSYTPAQVPVPAADTRTAAHFLEQATFGPTAADVALVESIGVYPWILQQFALPESPIPDATNDGNIPRNALFLNMANAPDQLRQRMIFALSQLIVVSANKTSSGQELVPWIRLLSRNAFGNYRTLLREVTVSPTMGKYLDMAYSRKAGRNSSPNENYPRELMQLFTIGLWDLNPNGTLKLDPQGQPIPSYSQETIQQMARAMTGWTFPTQPGNNPGNSNPEYFVGEMLPRITTHDTGAKTILRGRVLPATTESQAATIADMEAVVDAVFNDPNTAPFVSMRLIRSLVTSNPSPEYIHRVANVFTDNGLGVRGDLQAVLAAILMDPEASTFSTEDGRLKDVVLHILGMGRALGVTFANPDGFNFNFSNLSQRLLNSTTVFNFYTPLGLLPGHTDLFGPEFGIFPPALAIQRANFIYGLLNGQYSSSFPFSLAPFEAVAGDTTALVNLVNTRLMFGRMTPELHTLISAATNAVPLSQARDRALGAVYLAAISSEYAVYSDNSTAASAPGVQPPTAVRATMIDGNVVTLEWKPPLFGPAPTSYVLEGGVAPGQVIASMPMSDAPKVAVAVPPGAYYVRIHSVAGGAKSRASSEIRIYVGVAAGPTAPSSLLGVVNGSTLGLSWRNTYGGGAPTSVMLDVSGGLTTSLAIGMTEHFVFSGVPPGTYTFAVREINNAGTSGSSNSVTLTFPSTCSGTPSTPINFSATKSGNVVSLLWQPATTGRASTSYQVNVNGSFNGTIPTTSRSLSSPVGPGTYNIRVRAVNTCGNSSYTAFQTVTVP